LQRRSPARSSRRRLRGQASVLAVVVLVIAAMFIGLALLGYTMSWLNIQRTRQALTNAISQAMSGLGLYVEQVDNATFYIGVVDLLGGPYTFYVTLLNTSNYAPILNYIAYNATSGLTVYPPVYAPVSYVMILGSTGSYIPLAAFTNVYPKVYKVTVYSTISQLLVINATRPGNYTLIFMIQFDNYYYEFNRLRLSSG